MRAAISGVVREAIIAACLTGLMILLFLGSWRSTLIIAISIPLSILTSIIVLSALGETINIMTLGGLALAVGILVDDATVTIENIERFLEEGHSLHGGDFGGRGTDFGSSAGIDALYLYCVFADVFPKRRGEVPVCAVGGSGGVRNAGFVCTVANAGANLSDVPVKRVKYSWAGRAIRWWCFNVGSSGYLSVYVRSIKQCSPPWCTGEAIHSGVSGGCGFQRVLIPVLGRDFFPTSDTGQFRLHVRAKTGTRIEETARLCDLMDAAIRSRFRRPRWAAFWTILDCPIAG